MEANQHRRQASTLPKASDILADQLRQHILQSGLTPGASLPPEAELIEMWQFSRSTVREALRLLEVEGLIVIKRGSKGGVEVARPDATRLTHSLAILLAMQSTPVRQLIDFRLLIEPAAAASAARNATAAQRELLQQACEDEAGRGLQPSVDFHRLVGDATNDGILSVMLTSLHEVLGWQVQSESLTADQVEETRRVHRKLASLIASGDEDGAERAMRSHMEEFRSVLDDAGRLDDPIVPRAGGVPDPRMAIWKGRP